MPKSSDGPMLTGQESASRSDLICGPKSFVLVGPAHPYRGGIAHFIEHLFHGLADRGHVVSLVTFTRQYPDLLFPGKTQMVEKGKSATVTAHRMLDSINPFSWSKTVRYIETLNPDAVVFKYWLPYFAPSFGRIARQLNKKGVRTIVIVDNAVPHERRLGDVVIGRYFLKAASGLIAMSRQVQHDLVEVIRVGSPVSFVPHPVYDNFGPAVPRQVARERIDVRKEEQVLLFFGFIRKYKGLATLLKAMPSIVESLPLAKLIVAGEFYDEPDPYHELIRELGIGSHVDLHTEYIPDEQVSTFFSASDVVVQPYTSATQSGVAQIAFHYDRPVVVTDVGGLPEVVEDGVGLVVPPQDPDALASAVIRFFSDDLGSAMADAVHLQKRKYHWDRMYEAIESFLVE